MAEHNAGPMALSLSAVDFESITVSTAAIGLTAAKVDGAALYDNRRVAKVTVEAQPMRYRTDGTDPTAGVGHLTAAADVVWLYGSELAKFKAIRSGGVDAVLTVTYYQ